MPINSPVVGEIYNTLSSGADQWMYVYAIKGPYIYMSGIHNAYVHTKMRKDVLRGVANSYNYGSNGIRLNDGGILGLAGKQQAEGVLFLEGEDQ